MTQGPFPTQATSEYINIFEVHSAPLRHTEEKSYRKVSPYAKGKRASEGKVTGLGGVDKMVFPTSP